MQQKVQPLGNVQYVQKEVSGTDEEVNIEQPRIYFGLETNEIIATNAKNKQEYDYTEENGTEHTSNYEGKAGLNLNFLDRLVLGITNGNWNLAFSKEITNESKILINRNIIQRAKKALPYLIYDENPYTVITEDGRIVWVIDAYTVSNNYPYSQYTSIEHDNIKENINYIRNSVKVIVDSYDGTISYYITDRTDPIAMAYRNIYDTLFVDLDEEIPEDITEHFIYPEFLYKVQAEVLKIYHNVKPDVLYRADDLWDIAKYNSVKSTKSTGTYLNPYYTMVKTDNQEKLGLVQIYTPDEKQNIISYIVGTTNKGTNQLKLYKFSADSNIVGPMQLDKQIEEDDVISSELEALNTTGTKLTKQMIIVPIDNTLLYVEPIYQTMLNESEVPVLKKVIVASGNKVAIGDTLTKALENLLSTYAVDIEIENTDDVERFN
ncbi:MAG: COG1615 family transporter [Clostridia bacterium]|nr:COG1615 family transporter [Clostridia bacterium]